MHDAGPLYPNKHVNDSHTRWMLLNTSFAPGWGIQEHNLLIGSLIGAIGNLIGATGSLIGAIGSITDGSSRLIGAIGRPQEPDLFHNS